MAHFFLQGPMYAGLCMWKERGGGFRRGREAPS